MACLYSVGISIFLIQLLGNSNEAFGARLRDISRRVSRRSNGAIVFRDVSFIPKISKECELTGICDNMPNYPKSHVESIVRELINSTKFNEDMLDQPEIAQRFGESDTSLSLCRSMERLMKPQAARNMNNQWFYVINEIVGVSQTYRVEICDTKHRDCNAVVTFANGLESRCEQKYILRSMVALDYEGRPFENHFQVPSCCSCVYKV